MKFLLAGASGFLGAALRVRLAEQGHEVVRLVRREPGTQSELRWQPDRHELDDAALDGVDVVVNLAGAAVAPRPWTTSRRQLILASRVSSTGTLADALARRARSGGAPVLIQVSGISRYGTLRSELPHTEGSPAGLDFLSQVVVRWEAATQPAVDAGVRVVLLRTSPVMDAAGGSLQLMRLPWSIGLGARLGDGRQRMPMVSLRDWLRIVDWAAGNASASGAYNVTIPQPTNNADFTRTLGRLLGRPTLLRAPTAAVRTALGELAEQLLGDIYATPNRLTAEGFVFDGTDVESTLRIALNRPARSPA